MKDFEQAWREILNFTRPGREVSSLLDRESFRIEQVLPEEMSVQRSDNNTIRVTKKQFADAWKLFMSKGELRLDDESVTRKLSKHSDFIFSLLAELDEITVSKDPLIFYMEQSLTAKSLLELPRGFQISANHIAKLSKQNQVKGIHPIRDEAHPSVVILCTIGGINYANAWLGDGQRQLKYFLEGRSIPETNRKEFNLSISSNRAVIDSKGQYPILVFVRNKKGEPFSFSGSFRYERVVEDPESGYYFILNRETVQDQEAEVYEDLFDTETIKDSVFEGKKVLTQHYRRERDPSIIKKAIQLAKALDHPIRCEACSFSFEEKYGPRGVDFIEGHHRVPISTYDHEGGETSVQDIALVCANCHRMIHRKSPWLTIEELKEILKTSETQVTP